MSRVPRAHAGETVAADVSPEFVTRDVDHARHRLSAEYYPLELHPTSDGQFRLRMRTVALGPLTLGRLTYDTDIRKDCGELATAYHVNVTVSGNVRSTCGDEQVVSTPETAAVFNPTGRTVLDLWSGGSTQLCLKVARDVVDRELSERLGRPLPAPARFAMAMATASAPCRGWLHALHMLADELDAPGGPAAQPLLAAEVERLIVGGLVWGQLHSYSDELRAPAPAPRPRTVKLAVELIEDAPERAWTVRELAAASGVGVRALEEGFRRYLGRSPTVYLREVRLERVRAELLVAGPQDRTVGEVAYRWGFSHLGRFARAYAERYGESPSTTLRYG